MCIKIWLNNAVFRSKHAFKESKWQELGNPYSACAIACINNHTGKNEDGFVLPSVSILWPDCLDCTERSNVKHCIQIHKNLYCVSLFLSLCIKKINFHFSGSSAASANVKVHECKCHSDSKH